MAAASAVLMNGDDPCWYGMIGERGNLLIPQPLNSQLGVLLIAVRFHDVLAQPELLLLFYYIWMENTVAIYKELIDVILYIV